MEKNWGFVNWKTEHQLQTEMQDMNSMKSQSESLAKEYDRLDLYETNTNICVKFVQIIVWNKSTFWHLTFRLMEEKDRLQRKVNVMGEDKKDD